jgi:hypothetical protein
MEKTMSDAPATDWKIRTVLFILGVHAIVVLCLILSWEAWTLYQHLFATNP